MIFLFANQKGGVGKTTLCLQFANYMSQVKKQNVLVLDFDFQESISSLWEDEHNNHAEQQTYEVMKMDLEDYPNIIDKLIAFDGYILVDLPGKMDDNDLVPIYQSTNIVFTPFSYDEYTFKSTYVFTQVLHKLNPGVKQYFIPNRLKGSVNYSIMSDVNTVLTEYGTIVPPITDRVSFQRTTTLSIHADILSQVSETFDYILDDLAITI